MRRIQTVGLLFVLAPCIAQVSCFWMPSFTHHDSGQLLATARAYSSGKPANPAAAETPADVESAAAAERSSEEAEDYRRRIKSQLNEWDFAALDKEAEEDRANKSRLLGGDWKLYEFYEAVSKPTASSATEMNWVNHLETLRQWEAKEPNSVTPHIAMAETFINYAWHARGEGTSDTVTSDGWRSFGERIEMAASNLMDAAKMKEKCPQWFNVMQIVALAQGWDKQQARDLFESAVAYEPGYDRFYTNYAYFVQEKWYGEKGESAKFADEMAQRLGGLKGDYIYFRVAVDIVCTCESDKPPMPQGLSWGKVQRGYEAADHLYGLSNREYNEYALIAYVAGDKAAANEAFAKIGDDWDQKTWWKRDNFKDAKAWAGGI